MSPPDRLAHADRVIGVAVALRAAAPPGLTVVGLSYAVYYNARFPKDFVLPDVLVARSQESTRRRDHGDSREIDAELGVPHSWLIDPERHAATVLSLTGAGYEQALTAVGELVVAELFPVRVPL